MSHQLYRHYAANGELLYIGISLSTIGRLAQHKAKALWFDKIRSVVSEPCESREEARRKEAAAIANERPLYNVYLKPKHRKESFRNYSHMDANQIIDGIGGTVATAQLCQVTPQAVSQWREEGIPQARLMFLQLARPEVFVKRPKKTQAAA